MYPDAADVTDSRDHLAPEDRARLTKELKLLGFTAVHAQTALSAFSQPSRLTSSLLGTLPPLQACIEYLILQIPECDLPKRFRPSVNSSNSFVTAAHSGMDDIKRRWIEEKAVKECGWPPHVVKECLSDQELPEDWGKLVFALNCRLTGDDWRDATNIEPQDMEALDIEEVDSFGGKTGTNGELIIPLPMAPLILHVVTPNNGSVPTSATHPPMYLSSESVAAYVRLHILSKLLLAFKEGTLLEPGESIITAMMRLIEEEWAVIEGDGPPNISDVLQYLLPQKVSPPEMEPDTSYSLSDPMESKTKKPRSPRCDNRTDERVKSDFEELIRRGNYAKMLASREKLPAFTAKKAFLELLKSNPCVVVVGETGE